MKTGGVIIGIIGAALFVWHLFKVVSNPDYEGYASHQVMAMNAMILVVVGTGFYFWGRWRSNRYAKSAPRSSSHGDDDGPSHKWPDRGD